MIKNLTAEEEWVQIPLKISRYFDKTEKNEIRKEELDKAIETLYNTKDFKLKSAIIFFLGSLKRKDFFKLISDFMRDENEIVRFSAFCALNVLDDKFLENYLPEIIYDHSEVNRFLCVQTVYELAGLFTDEISQIREKIKKIKKFNKLELSNEEKSILDKYHIYSLWHITHIKNLFNVLKNGIICRNKIERFDSIANEKVISKRPDWSKNYVPLFYSDNTPMLYVVSKEHGCENLVILEVDPAVLFLNNTRFSDGNIASNKSNVYLDINDLKELSWDIIFSSKPAFSFEWKRIRSAEVLVHDRVQPCFIKKIHFFKFYNAMTIYKELWQKFLKTIFREYELDIEVKFDFYEEGVR